MLIEYLVSSVWTWVAQHGLVLLMLVLLAFLIPRAGRRMMASLTDHAFEEGTERAKGHKAIAGAMVYLAEAAAYIVLFLIMLKNLGVSLGAAAIPATVVSAAVGFGAQKIIGDLLGGFFIIIEKQYGVGDWVRFYGTHATVEGDVVDMTLRATTIRTLHGEEVIVPNGEARICINASARWARAVVEVPVPISAGGSIAEIKARTLAAARHAIVADELVDDVRSDITMQAVTTTEPPTAMGLPWTATLRMLIDVAPGRQWAVERSVRSGVLNEWWEDYGRRASDTRIATPTDAVSAGEAHTAREEGQAAHLAESADTTAFAAPTADTEPTPTEIIAASSSPEEAAQAIGSAYDVAEVPRGEVAKEIAENLSSESKEELEKALNKKKKTAAQKRVGLFSLGGRIRPSTFFLLLSLLIVMVVNLMTVSESGEGGFQGWLAPSRLNHNNQSDTGTVSSETATSERAVETVPSSVPNSVTPDPSATDDVATTAGQATGQQTPARGGSQQRTRERTSGDENSPTSAEPTGGEAPATPSNGARETSARASEAAQETTGEAPEVVR